MADWLSGLNADQQRAVLHDGGPLFIVAGPGSGKTRVIVHRIARLLESRAERRLLAITFTNRAAGEMTNRTRSLVDDVSALRCGTFHWACNSLLRRHVHRLGYARDFRLLGPSESRAALAASLSGRPPATVAMLASAISAVKNGMTVDDAARQHRLPVEELSASMAAYDRTLRLGHALDLDDLQHKAVEVLRSDPAIREACRAAFDELLVDEYQDTNPVQQELLTLLAPSGRAVTAVGDEDQAIYGWRQAGGGGAAGFRQRFPEARVILLGQTYRSTKRILRAASTLIEHNRNRAKYRLRTDRPAGAIPVCYIADDERDEADWIGRRIRALLQEGVFREADIALLYRVNAQSRALEDALVRHTVPYRVFAGRRFYQRPEVRAVVALLRLALDPRDEEAVSWLLAELPGIGPKRLEAVRRAAVEQGTDVFSTLRSDTLPLPASLRHHVGRLAAEVETLGARRVERLERLLETAIEIVARLFPPEVSERTEVGSTALDELLSVVRDLPVRQATLRSFIDRLAMGSDGTGDASGVSLISLHAAKGLEFQVVFIAGAEEGLLPHRRALERDGDIEEERRLCYVGMTRAQSLLFLTYAHTRLLGGQALIGAPSRFLTEMGVSNVDISASGRAVDRQRLVTVSLGERLVHARWGTGTVTRLEGSGRDTLVTIAFDGAGTQRLQLCHAPLIRSTAEHSRVCAG